MSYNFKGGNGKAQGGFGDDPKLASGLLQSSAPASGERSLDEKTGTQFLVTKKPEDKTTMEMTTSQAGLDALNAMIQKVNNATQFTIDNLAENEKISLKALTKRVAGFLGLSQSLCSSIVAMYVKSSDKCTMQRGRNGGIYKGKFHKEVDPRCDHCGQKLRAKERAQKAA